jgi:hypothetical protein
MAKTKPTTKAQITKKTKPVISKASKAKKVVKTKQIKATKA